MTAWLKRQNATVKGMIIIGIMLLAGIFLRWDYISSEAGGALKGIFRKQGTTMAAPSSTE